VTTEYNITTQQGAKLNIIKTTITTQTAAAAATTTTTITTQQVFSDSVTQMCS
jgi:hypothetical protein